MTEIPELPETAYSHRKRGRIQVQPIKENSDHPPLTFTYEADGCWTVHGLGESGLTLPADGMIALAESVLRCAR